MIDIIRRTVWTFLAFCVATSLAADSYHPHIRKSQVVSLDVAAIERNAQSGTPFELVLGEVQLNVALSPAPIWPKEGLPVLEVGKDGGLTRRTVQGNITYAGDVVGEDPEASEARFTITRGVLEGYVLSKSGWWFVEPLSRFDPKAGAEQFLVYATRDLDFVLDYGDDGVIADQVFDPCLSFNGRIGIAMAADSLYVSLSGQDYPFEARHAALINAVNGIYRDQTGREFAIEISIADFQGTMLTSSNAHTLLDQFADFVDFVGGLPGLSSDIAHLTAGRYLNDDILGVAFQPGVIGLSHQEVVWAGGGGGGGGAGASLAFQNMMVAAHELGHNFDGEHDEADEWCVTDVIICLDYERTIMWPSFYDDNNSRFSDGTRNPAHDNKRRIRNNMACRGF